MTDQERTELLADIRTCTVAFQKKTKGLSPQELRDLIDTLSYSSVAGLTNSLNPLREELQNDSYLWGLLLEHRKYLRQEFNS
jgi:hypothetical protein